MFIVDFHTLQTVYSLNLLDHVILYSTDTLDLQDIVWVYTTFSQLITCLDYLAFCYLDTGTVRDQIGLGVTGLKISNNDLTFSLGIFDVDYAAKFGDDRKTLRFTGLEKILDTRKTLCDIAAGNAAAMESTHGQLGTWLTDGLSCDDTNSLANLYCLASSHVRTITFCTDTDVGFTA